MKTINYELAKKLYDAGVRIESEMIWTNTTIYNRFVLKKRTKKPSRIYTQISAPNCEEVIEFLPVTFQMEKNWKWYLREDTSCKLHISPFLNSERNKCYTVAYIHWNMWIYKYFNWNTLLEAFEATLEYLLNNWYIWTEKKS